MAHITQKTPIKFLSGDYAPYSGFTFEIGKQYRQSGRLEMCLRGFHYTTAIGWWAWARRDAYVAVVSPEPQYISRHEVGTRNKWLSRTMLLESKIEHWNPKTWEAMAFVMLARLAIARKDPERAADIRRVQGSDRSGSMKRGALASLGDGLAGGYLNTGDWLGTAIRIAYACVNSNQRSIASGTFLQAVNGKLTPRKD